jgi:hypothetical protein
VSGSQLLLLGGTQQVVSDPNFEYTTLLLPGNGTNGAQNNTFLDSSTNNFTITRNGNTTQGTFSPFSQTGWGNYFDGSGDYLTVADNAALQMGSGDFTIEYWWYPNNITSYQNPIDKGYTGAGGLLLQTGNGDGRIIVYASGSTVITSSTSVTVNAWNHMALVRSGTTLTLYQNGVSVGSATNSTNFNNTTQLGIGATGSPVVGSFPVVGYLSNVRFVKGTAVYSGSTYTVPTAPLTAITNTSLLTCQSNRFIDNSTNAFAITRNGDVSVQAFSPFNPTAAWSASTNGGSGYFDGSGDYLNGPATGQFAPTGNFTISMWIYPTSFAASFYVLAGSWNTGTSNEWLIQYDNTGAIRFLTTTDSTFSAAGVIKLNQWQFISISRTGSTLTGYVNGTSFRSYTLTGTVGVATKIVYIGAQIGTTWPYIGYMANFRLVDGSAESATPPTSPATAISGTNMLLNYTNAGIYDATSKNDLETVGNAQISTTQSKFGGSSMYFDGTGDGLRQSVAPLWSFGTADFTIEAWVYPTAFAAGSSIITCQNQTNGTAGLSIALALNASGQPLVLAAASTGAYAVNFTGTALSLNTWTHVAVTRYGNTFTIWQNGISTATASSSVSISQDSTAGGYGGWNIGYSPISGQTLTGYIDDFRFTKGIARYTSNFTAPTVAFPLL